uniref:Variant surface glycoprotein 1125.2584 n=1 Tax=Trypanosoma brucei TaxID=5691 RepID=A0A1J0R8E7_9TRYP|nr:variant surface glycoprotein 1125.2584 [Trypanosoma brucei]
MNMSVADESRQSLFDKDGPPGDWDQMKKTLKADDNKLEWAEDWGKWKEQRADTKKHTTGNDWGKKNPRPADKNLLLQARELINHTATKAKELIKTRDTLKGKSAAQLTITIAMHLKNAMCGSDETHKYDDRSKKCKDITGEPTAKAVKCAAPQNGQALATDILCICSDHNEDACAAGAAHGNHANGNIPNNEISKITGGCPNHGVARPLDIAITTALGRVASRIRNLETTKTVVGIGKLTSGTDCKSFDQANCVNYKDLLIGSYKGYNKIPWYNELSQAANAVRQFQQLQRHAATTDANVKQLRNQAESRYRRKVVLISAITNNKEANNDNTIEEKQQECEKHKDNKTACENAKCKWEGKTETVGPCKPKDGEGQTNAAPGTADIAAGGAEAGATGCTRHGTNKAKCENDKTGDKQNCAFRKGKYK